MSKKATKKNLKRVLDELARQAMQNNDDCKVICEAVNEMLDGLLENDFFGTEGQTDPRGDRRNNE